MRNFDIQLEAYQNTKNMYKEKKGYYKTLQNIYGFDSQTAKIIVKVRQKIDKKHPNFTHQMITSSTLLCDSYFRIGELKGVLTKI